MLLSPALLLYAAQASTTVQIAGRAVPVAPVPTPESPSQEFTGWSGWGPFAGTPGSAGDVPTIDAAALATPLASDAAEWHLKVAVFQTTDIVETGGHAVPVAYGIAAPADPKEGRAYDVSGSLRTGPVRSYRFFMQDPQVDATLAALARLPGEVAKATGGKVRLVVDATLESDPARETVPREGAPFDEFWRQAYFGPRINGGRYEAEDRVFRGPYPGAVLVAPGFGDTRVTTVNGTPVATAFLDGRVADPALFEAWLQTARKRSASLGFGGSVGGSVPWKRLADGEPLTAEDLARTPPSVVDASNVAFLSPFRPQPSYLALGGKVEIIKDVDRGPVLRLTEDGPNRTGGVALPTPADGLAVGNNGVLTFWYRSDAKEPISVAVRGEGDRVAWFSLGRDRKGATNAATTSLDVASDGKWHQVGLDLKSAGIAKITAVRLEPSPNARSSTKTTISAPTWDFDDFALGASGATPTLATPAPGLTSPDPEARLASLSTADAANLASLLNDPDADVRLNAAVMLDEKPEASVAPAILAATNNLDPRVAQTAVQAYAKLNLPEKRDQLLRILKFGITGLAKAEAAMQLADSGEPKLAGEIMTLLANRNGEVRRAAADALGRLPGREPGIIRTAFLRLDDPGIKLSVTISSDGSDETQASKLQWSAVNEPSDLVRLWSAIRLVPSTLPAARTDGYRVVRDDSFFVRQRLVEWMGANPSEAHRPALKLALTDKSPLVRAAAVAALKRLPKGASAEELKAVATDPDPRVRAAMGT